MTITDAPAAARTVAPAHRALIDELLSPSYPAWFAIAGTDGPALVAALDAIEARDYLIAGCAADDGARRVLEIAQTLDTDAATPFQAATVCAIAAYASLVLNQCCDAHCYLLVALSFDPDHRLALKLAAAQEDGAPREIFRLAALLTRHDFEDIGS